MPRVKASYPGNGSAAQTINYSAAENDFMFLMSTRRYGSTPSAPSGWTALTYNQNSQNGCTNNIWYRRASASEPTSVTVTTNTTSHNCLLIVCSGVNTSTAFDVTLTSRSNGSTAKGTSPAITPANANTMILYLVMQNGVAMAANLGVQKIQMTGTASGGYLSAFYTYGNGASVAVPAHDWTFDSTASNNPAMVTICLRDDGNAANKGYIDKDNPPATLISLMGGGGGRTGHLGGTTDLNVSSVISSLDGTTTSHRVGTGRGAEYEDFVSSFSYEATYIQQDCQVTGHSLASSVDLESEIVVLSSSGGKGMYSEYASLGKHFLLGDGTNYRSWKIDAIDTVPTGSEQPIPCVIEVDGGFDSSADEVGTVNSSVLQALTHIAMGGPGRGSYQGNSVGFLYKLNTMVILGGSSAFPADMIVGVDQARTASLRTVSNQIRQSQTQFFCLQSVQVGNGSVATVWDSSGHSIEFPGASSEAGLRVQVLVSANKFSFVFYASASCNFDISNCTFNLGNQHTFGFHASFNSSATLNESGALVINATLACNDVGRALAGMSFSQCTENTGDANFSGGNTFSNCLEDQYFTVTSEAEFAKLYNCTFRNNSVRAIRITGDQSGTWSDPNITMSGNTVDIVYTGATDFSIQSANTITVSNTGAGTLTVVTPIETLTINSDVASTLIRYFEDDSQTIVDSTTGTTLDYDYPDTDPIDIELVKQGYVPINRQNVTPFDGDLDIEMDFDESYNASHGLTITTEYDYVRATKVLTINSDQNALDVRSALADVIRTNSSYYNTKLLMEAIPGLTRVDLIDGMTITSMATWKGAGMERFDAADASNPVEKWFCVKSLTNIPGAGVYYRQTDSGDATSFALTNNVVDEAFQYYSDPNHDGSTADGYDYSGYMVIKSFLSGSRQGRVDVVANSGLSALRSNLYTVPLANEAHGYSGSDPGISADLTLIAGGTVGGETFAYEIVDGGTNSGEDIANQLHYNAVNNPNSVIPGGTGLRYFELGDMVIFNGSSIETVRGFREGATPTQVGFYVSQSSADHPDFARFQADNGNYYTPATNYSLTISGLVSGSQVQIFETGTQTILDSTASSGTSFVYSGVYSADQTVDYTVILEGYFLIRVTGVTLSNSPVSQSVNMQADRAYQASSGLAFGTTATVNTSTKVFTVTTATTVQNWYSFMVESWKSQSALRNIAFPISTNGPNSFSLNDGYEWGGSSTDFLSRDGFRYVDSGGTETASWAAFLSQGVPSGLQVEYQQVEGTGEADAANTGDVDQVIQIYGDASHGNFDYRGHLVFKVQANGYEQARADVVATYGTLEDQFYVISLNPVEIAGLTTGDPGITGVTITDHGASPVTWNSLDFSITITDSGTNSAENILRWINYNLSLDATFQGKDAFNWSDMVFTTGSSYETARGPIEGDTGATLKGVRVLRGSGEHPDFARHQADDGSYYTPPTTASVSAPNLTAGRVQLYNVTTDTEIENTTITTGYSRNWTNGTDATSGDVLRLRWTAAGSQEISATGVATVDGTTTFLDAPVSDSVYTAYGIDGSTVTEYSSDFPNVEVDINDPDNVFYIDRFYAWYKYEITTADGIRNFFGGVSAINASNLQINNSVVDIYFDNTKATSARQGDTILIQRADGAYPQVTTTSGGGGLGFYYTGLGYTVTTGSGVTSGDKTDIIDGVHSKIVEGSETFIETTRIIRAATAGKSTAPSGGGAGTYTFRDEADSKARITATVDADGQRTAVTTDGT